MGSKSTHLLDSTEYFQIVLYCNNSCNNSYHSFQDPRGKCYCCPHFPDVEKETWWLSYLVQAHEANEMRGVAIQNKLCLITKPTVLPQDSPAFGADKTLVHRSVKCQVQIFLLKCKPGLSTLWVLKNWDNSPILLKSSRLGKPLGRFVFGFETHSKRMGSEPSRQ